MKHFLHHSARFLALVTLTALVLRPVVVSVQNVSAPQPYAFSDHSPAPSLTGQAPQDRDFAKTGVFSPLRILQKENQDPSSWGPRVSKQVAFHAVHVGLLPLPSQPSVTFPHSIRILRI